MRESIPVIQIGLGPIGRRISRYLVGSGAFRLLGAVDIDPAKIGHDVGTLAQIDPLGLTVVERLHELPLDQKPVAILSTVSSLTKAAPQILEAVSAGLPVVSTCEELAYPWITHHRLAQQIDREARNQGVGVLGTGINPGFLMDLFPVFLSAVCLQVKHVAVERVQDATDRRLPFREKIGVGLTVQQFKDRVSLGDLRHVGLTESMHMIADRLGWRLDLTEDHIDPVIAEHDVHTAQVTVPEGRVLGVEQIGQGFLEQTEVIRLRFRATLGEAEPHDSVTLDGEPSVHCRIPGGINGDIGTGAITINAIPSLLASPPGLRTMADVMPVSCFNALRQPAKSEK